MISSHRSSHEAGQCNKVKTHRTVPVHATKTWGEAGGGEVQVSSLTSVLGKIICQLHAPAALLPVPIDRTLGPVLTLRVTQSLVITDYLLTWYFKMINCTCISLCRYKLD